MTFSSSLPPGSSFGTTPPTAGASLGTLELQLTANTTQLTQQLNSVKILATNLAKQIEQQINQAFNKTIPGARNNNSQINPNQSRPSILFPTVPTAAQSASAGQAAGQNFSSSFQKSAANLQNTIKNIFPTAAQAASAGQAAGKGYASKVEESVNPLKGIINNIFQGLGIGSGVGTFNAINNAIGSALNTATNFGKEVFNITKDFQSYDASLKTFFKGNQQEVDQFNDKLAKFSASTPFQLQNLQKAALENLASGSKPDQIIQDLKTLGNVAAGANTDLNELVTTYGKARQQGRISNEDIDVFQSKNVPVRQEIGKLLGASDQEVTELATDGKLQFNLLEEAIKSMTQEGGVYFDALANKSKTLDGQISNIQDTLYQFQKNLGQAFEPIFSIGAEYLDQMAKGLTSNKDLIGELRGQTQELADYFRQNPEIARNLQAALNELVRGAMAATISGARQLGEFLKENPRAIQDSVGAMIQLASTIGTAAKSAADLVGWIAQFSKGVLDAAANVRDQLGNALASLGIGKKNDNPILNTLIGDTSQEDAERKESWYGKNASPLGRWFGQMLGYQGIQQNLLTNSSNATAQNSIDILSRKLDILTDPNKEHHDNWGSQRAYYEKNDEYGRQRYREDGGMERLVKNITLGQNGKQEGVPIPSAQAGILHFKNDPRGYGNYAELTNDQGQVIGRYAHFSSDNQDLKSGQRVVPGQILGYQGRTGDATGITLHAEMPPQFWNPYVQAMRTGDYSALQKMQGVGGAWQIPPGIQQGIDKVQKLFAPPAQASSGPLNAQSIANKYGLQSLRVEDLQSGNVLGSYNASTPPASPASTIKLIVGNLVADAINQGKESIKQQLTLKPGEIAEGSSLKAGQKISIEQLITEMLKNSDNTAANALIDWLGGLDKATQAAIQKGFKNTKFGSLLSIPGVSGFKNISTAKDTTNALRNLLLDNSEAGNVASEALRSTRNFHYQGEEGGKIGNNSKVIGNVGIININGREYIITSYANVNGNIDANKSIITNATNAVGRALSGAAPSSAPNAEGIYWGKAANYAPSDLSGLTARGQKALQYLSNPNIRAFLDATAVAENGAIANTTGGYGVLVGTESRDTFNPNNLQDHPRRRVSTGYGVSSATGRYQVIDTTWDATSQQLGLKDFKPQSQEILAVGLLMGRGIADAIAKGNIASALPKASQEWASLQGNPYGQGTAEGRSGTFLRNYSRFRQAATPTPVGIIPSASTDTTNPPGPTGGTPQNQRDLAETRRKLQEQNYNSIKAEIEDANKAQDASVKQQRELDAQSRKLAADQKRSELQLQLAGAPDADTKQVIERQLQQFETTNKYDEDSIKYQEQLEDLQKARSRKVQAINEGQRRIAEITPESEPDPVKRAQKIRDAQLNLGADAGVDYTKAIGVTNQALQQNQADKAKALQALDVGNQTTQDQTAKTLDRQADVDKLNQSYQQTIDLLKQQQALAKTDVDKTAIQQEITRQEAIQKTQAELMQLQQQLEDVGDRKAFDQIYGGLSEDSKEVQNLNKQFDILNAKIESTAQSSETSLQTQAIQNQRALEQAALQDQQSALTKRSAISGSQDSLLSSQAKYIRAAGGNEYAAGALDTQAAQLQEQIRYSQELLQIDQQIAAAKGTENEYTADQVQQLKSNADLVNKINLASISAQAKTLGNDLTNVAKNSLGGFFTNIITGSGNARTAFKDLFSSIANQLAQLASNQLLSNLFGGKSTQFNSSVAGSNTNAGILGLVPGLLKFGKNPTPGVFGLGSSGLIGSGNPFEGGDTNLGFSNSFSAGNAGGFELLSSLLGRSFNNSSNALGGGSFNLLGLLPGLLGKPGSTGLFGLGAGTDLFGLGGGDPFAGGDTDGLGFFGGLGFYKGGIVPNFASGGAVADALQRERAASGKQPVLAALTPGEMVLTTQQAQRFQELRLDKVLNFATGGTVGGQNLGLPTQLTAPTQSNTNINIPITTQGDNSSVDVPRLHNSIRSVVLAEIQRQQRPGGALNTNSSRNG